MAKVLVQFTKNYDLFILREDNRDVNDAGHIKALMESMQRNGFLQSKAISVRNNGTKYEVLDGQHRLEAAKKLGIVLWYNIDDEISETALPDLQIAKKWQPKDYLKHFIVNGVTSYIKLKELSDTYSKCSITTIVILLEGAVIGGAFKQRFTTGKVQIKHYDKAVKLLQLADELYKLYKQEWLFGRTFLVAFSHISDIPGYNHKIMIDKLKINSENFRQMITEEGYYKMWNEIYNFRAKTNKLKIIFNKD